MKTPLSFQTLVAGTIKPLPAGSRAGKKGTGKKSDSKTVRAIFLMLVIASGATLINLLPEAEASDKLIASEVLELMQQGKIKPLLTLIAEHNFQGTLLDAELEREDGRLIYELEYLNHKGEVWEYELDAATGEILDQERDD